jgi:hypothetical protein
MEMPSDPALQGTALRLAVETPQRWADEWLLSAWTFPESKRSTVLKHS